MRNLDSGVIYFSLCNIWLRNLYAKPEEESPLLARVMGVLGPQVV